MSRLRAWLAAFWLWLRLLCTSESRMALTGTSTSTSYTGNGATAFPTGFHFFDAADLVVTVDGVLKTLGVDYTVSGGAGVDGTVTFTAAPANNAAILISRSTPKTQPVSFRTQGYYSPSVHENAFDRATMIAQEDDAHAVALNAAMDTRVSSLEESRTTDEAAIAANAAAIAQLEVQRQFSDVTHTNGTGSQMVVTGNAPQDAVHVFEVQMLADSGQSGTDSFQWREDGGAWVGPLAASELPEQLGTTGVYVSWPGGVVAVTGETYSFTSNPPPSNVALTDKAQTFTQAQTLSGGVTVTKHHVGGAGEPAWLNGYFPDSLPGVFFWKDVEGRVNLSGLAAASSGTSGAIFALPAGFRPAATVYVPVVNYADGPGKLEILSIDPVSGQITPVIISGSALRGFCLDGISFPT